MLQPVSQLRSSAAWLREGSRTATAVLYHPTPNMLVGPELLWGERENKDGSDGDDTRIQVSFKYNFDGTIFGGAR
jgi:hypothetical protein